MKELNFEQLNAYRSVYDADQNAHTLNAAMAKTDLKELAFVPTNAAKLNGAFEVEVKTRGITAQQKSGRCWMFAAMNILREKAADKFNLKDFELSQNYLTFYDKLEKANNFLEMVIENADHPLKDDMMMDYLLNWGIGDGGYWNQAVDLIEKYGVCPKDANPETYQSEHTETFMTLLNILLKKDASELRQLVKDGKDPEPRKNEMLAEVYKAECIAFGQPVKTFDFAYRDEKNEYHVIRHITPKEFYDTYIGISLSDYAAIDCTPSDFVHLHQTYTFHSTCNMSGKDMHILELPQEDLESLSIKQLRDNEPVWFACDADAYGARKEGIWDPASVNYEGLLGNVSFAMSREDRLAYKASSANHAMLLTGVNFDENGKPNRWKIENSWGKDVGKSGYFTASEAYFKQYVYEVVILKKYLNAEQRAVLAKEPVKLQPWEAE